MIISSLIKLTNKVLSPHIPIEEFGIDLSKHINISPNPDLGDYGLNISFRLAKPLKKSPKIIAEEIVELFKSSKVMKDPNSIINDISSANGYVNFILNSSKLAEELFEKFKSDSKDWLLDKEALDEKLIVEHTSANPTKPLHIGHVRNSILGDTIARMYSSIGYKIDILNYIDDMGKQMAVLITGFLEELHLEVPREKNMKYDVWLGLIYSFVANKAKNDSKLENIINEVMKSVKSDKSLFSYSREIALNCVLSNLETMSALNISYDLLIWESDIVFSNIWNTAYDILKRNPDQFGLGEGELEGAFIAKLSKLKEFKNKKNPDKVIVRSNGVPTYIAHDIGLQFWKLGLIKDVPLKYYPIGTYKLMNNKKKLLYSSNYRETPNSKPMNFGNAKKVINVIGTEQEHLQTIINYILRLLDENAKADNSFHLSYKHVTLKESKFSGRSGNWYEEESWADKVLEKTISACYSVTSEKRPDLDEAKKKYISELLGVSALRYWIIKFSTETPITFDYESVTSLIGDTGPFILYSVVRAKRILEKSEINIFNQEFKISNFTLLQDQREKLLIFQMASLPTTLKTYTLNHKPSEFARYVYRTAELFNQFYEHCPVLKENNDDVKMVRIALVNIYIEFMNLVLQILGIEIPEEM